MKLKNEVLQLAFDLKNNFDQIYRGIDGSTTREVYIKDRNLCSDLSKLFSEEREYAKKAIQIAAEVDDLSSGKIGVCGIFDCGLPPFLEYDSFSHEDRNENGNIESSLMTIMSSRFDVSEFKEFVDATTFSEGAKELIKREAMLVYDTRKLEGKNDLDYAYLAVLEYLKNIFEHLFDLEEKRKSDEKF